jgi:TolA-binding protein
MTTARRAAPALLLLAAGCWVPVEHGRQMDARIQRLEVETRESDDQNKLRLAQLEKRVQEAQARLDELGSVARAKGADLGVSVVRLQEELTRLKGDLEAQQHHLGQVEEAQRSAAKEVDARLASLKGAGALDEALARQRLAELPKPDDRAAVLALAQKQDADGEKGIARELYLHYLRRWPKGERADEAGLRAGELLGAQGRWREAVVVLGKVAEEHPKSERAPAALLLVAEGMVQLGRKDDARAFLEQVVAEHPKTEVAAKAKAKLAELFPPAKDAKKAPPKKK